LIRRQLVTSQLPECPITKFYLANLLESVVL